MLRTAPGLLLLLLAIQPSSLHAQNQSPPQAPIPGVFAKDAHIELVHNGFQALEGPIATHDGGLYFNSVDGARTYKLAANGAIDVWREHTNNANGQFLLNDGRLLGVECGCYPNASRPSQVAAVNPDGKVQAIATQFHGPNDLIADRNGGIYFTDPGPRFQPNVAVGDRRGDVYYIRPTGELLLLDSEMVYPNGITLSLDQKTLFVDDTFSEYVFAFDVQADGSVKNKRHFVKLKEPEQWPPWGLRSRADGMAMDSKGRLYVGTSAGIQVIDPAGRHLGTIRTPAIIRNLAFAGPKRQTLYMTAIDALYRVELLSQGAIDRAK